MQNEKIVVAYCRVSSQEQAEKQTIENQKVNITEFAKKKGISINRWFEDVAKSGRTEDRPQFRELFRHIGDFDILIVDAIDRLSRDTATFLQVRSMLLDNNIELISLKEPEMEYETADGEFIYTLRAALAAREVRRHSERISEGIQRHKEKFQRWGRYKQRERLERSKKRILSLYGTEDDPGISCADLARIYAVSWKLMKSVLVSWRVYRKRRRVVAATYKNTL